MVNCLSLFFSFFAVVSKLVQRGYQSHWADFLLRINFNHFYVVDLDTREMGTLPPQEWMLDATVWDDPDEKVREFSFDSAWLLRAQVTPLTFAPRAQTFQGLKELLTAYIKSRKLNPKRFGKKFCDSFIKIFIQSKPDSVRTSKNRNIFIAYGESVFLNVQVTIREGGARKMLQNGGLQVHQLR